jgi:hypothetical protein
VSAAAIGPDNDQLANMEQFCDFILPDHDPSGNGMLNFADMALPQGPFGEYSPYNVTVLLLTQRRYVNREAIQGDVLSLNLYPSSDLFFTHTLTLYRRINSRND